MTSFNIIVKTFGFLLLANMIQMTHAQYSSTTTTGGPTTVSSGLWRLIVDGDFDALMDQISSDSGTSDIVMWANDLIWYLLSSSGSISSSELTVIVDNVMSGSILVDYEFVANDKYVLDNALRAMNYSVGTDYDYSGIYYPIKDNINLKGQAEAATAAAVGVFVFFILICCCCSVCCVFIIILNCILMCNKKCKEKKSNNTNNAEMIGTVINSGGTSNNTGAVADSNINSDSDGGDGVDSDGLTSCIYRVKWIIALPLRFIMFIFGRICTCNGCNQKTGSYFIQFLTSTFSTSLLLAHFSFTEKPYYQEALAEGISKAFFGGSVKGEVIYGLTIVVFAVFTFINKLFKLRKSHKEWQEKPNETSVSIRIKDLNVVIIGASDAIFKILAGFAVIIGSAYAGMDEHGVFTEEMLKKVIDYIFIAALFGPIKELSQLLEQYLTFAVMFTVGDGEKVVSSKKIFNWAFDEERIKTGIFDSVFNKINEIPETKPKYSAQKTILWNAVWSGFKLFLLLLQQLFGFLAALLLLGTGKDIAWFLLIVLLFNLSMIIIAFLFCSKYQRMSVGLCCKYYFCCFYQLCPKFCEEKLIKLDPVENKQEFTHLGFFVPDHGVELKVDSIDVVVEEDGKIQMPQFYCASYSQGVYGSYTAFNF